MSRRRRLVVVGRAVVVSVPVHRVRLADLLFDVVGAGGCQLLPGTRREVVAVLVVLIPRLVTPVDLRRVLPRVGRRLARRRRRVRRVGRVVLEPLARLTLILLRVLVRVLHEAGRGRRRSLQAGTTARFLETAFDIIF